MTTSTVRLISLGQARDLTKGPYTDGQPEIGGTFYVKLP